MDAMGGQLGVGNPDNEIRATIQNSLLVEPDKWHKKPQNLQLVWNALCKTAEKASVAFNNLATQLPQTDSMREVLRCIENKQPLPAGREKEICALLALILQEKNDGRTQIGILFGIKKYETNQGPKEVTEFYELFAIASKRTIFYNQDAAKAIQIPSGAAPPQVLNDCIFVLKSGKKFHAPRFTDLPWGQPRVAAASPLVAAGQQKPAAAAEEAGARAARLAKL
jgi:hypothetical protein